MTNVTLSIEDPVYKKMKQFSEIKWSEFIRKMIKYRLEELEMLEKNKNNQAFLCMLASEDVLKEDLESEEDNEAWEDL